MRRRFRLAAAYLRYMAGSECNPRCFSAEPGESTGARHARMRPESATIRSPGCRWQTLAEMISPPNRPPSLFFSERRTLSALSAGGTRPLALGVPDSGKAPLHPVQLVLRSPARQHQGFKLFRVEHDPPLSGLVGCQLADGNQTPNALRGDPYVACRVTDRDKPRLNRCFPRCVQ